MHVPPYRSHIKPETSIAQDHAGDIWQQPFDFVQQKLACLCRNGDVLDLRGKDVKVAAVMAWFARHANCQLDGKGTGQPGTHRDPRRT